jgi:uncharacterized protein (DUF885 family)
MSRAFLHSSAELVREVAVVCCVSALFACSAASASAPEVQVTGVAQPHAAAPKPDPVQPNEGLRALVTRYGADRGALERFWQLELSQHRAERLLAFDREWLARLAAIDFDALDQEARIDWTLLRFTLEDDVRKHAIAEKKHAETEPLRPYTRALLDVIDGGQRLEEIDPARAATALEAVRKSAKENREGLAKKKDAPAVASDGAVKDDAASRAGFARPVLVRAAGEVDGLRSSLESWKRERSGYDPAFSWWVDTPAKALLDELQACSKQLREDLAGLAKDDEKTIVGDPIGREALQAELAAAMIAYTPEELLEIADRELAWCRARMLEASRELGHGDDWKAALEDVKRQHVAPGEQPRLIRDLAEEATRYVEDNALVTVPPLAKEIWRMEMMSPERQLQSPFFTGGEVISVSFPTDTMSNEEKEMSLRGNNIHFSRATVHHELIPGHHLQMFMNARYMPHRAAFATPFWMEGWALYWEMLLWDRGFARTPEDRIGMLFWRSHRCARIRFSLSFHLGLWTPEQCIDFLVDEIGHERENAAAEVRRSFRGGYEPLYQLAYMVGALQLRDLRHELVDGGRMTEREFHDGVLEGGSMPIEMVRARLAKRPLARDFEARWRFYDLGR